MLYWGMDCCTSHFQEKSITAIDFVPGAEQGAVPLRCLPASQPAGALKPRLASKKFPLFFSPKLPLLV